MGNLPSTVSCDPATFDLSGIDGGLYAISDRLFSPQCQFDTTGPTLSVTLTNFHDCITSCASTKACKAISWLDNTCYQKAAVGNLIASDAVSSFVSTDDGQALACPDWDGLGYTSNDIGFNIKCGIDYPGVGDMGSSEKPDLQSCIDSCATTTTCVAVAYSGRSCYMKNAIGPAVPNSNVQTAVKDGIIYTPPADTPPADTPPASPAGSPSCPGDNGKVFTSLRATYTIYCDADYYGGDLISTHSDSFAGCIAACDANEQCIDVSYVSGACYLKSRLTTLSSTHGVWTAVLEDVVGNNPGDTSPTPSGNLLSMTCPSTSTVSYTSHAGNKDTAFELSCGTDYYGGDFLSIEKNSLAECVDACASESQCIALAYRGVGCYLKSTLNTPTVDPASDVIGGKVLIAPAPGTTTSSSTSAPATTTTEATTTTTETTTTTTTEATTTTTEATTTTTEATTTTTEATTTTTEATTSTTTTTTTSPTPTPLVNLNSCPEAFSCKLGNAKTCSSKSNCYCFSSPTYGAGFCTNDLTCNSSCSKDADCSSGYMCAIGTCCPNSNGSLCVRAVNPTCANASAAKYLFAKMKRDRFYSDVLGKYIEKVGAN